MSDLLNGFMIPNTHFPFIFCPSHAGVYLYFFYHLRKLPFVSKNRKDNDFPFTALKSIFDLNFELFYN